MKESERDDSVRWFTVDELSEMLRGHIICPECCREACEEDLIEVIDNGNLYRCPECGCEYLNPNDEDD